MTEELAQSLIAAAASLEKAIARLDAQQQSLNAQIDRIVAAVDDNETATRQQLESRIAELEAANTSLKAEAARLSSARKTLPPLVTALLAKTGIEGHERIDPATLDQALAPLTIDQRIAVKAQMARAGLID